MPLPSGTTLGDLLLARIPLTMRHSYDFGADRDRVGDDLLNPESWDAIRETAGPFGLPLDRFEWERAARDGDFAQRAKAISRVVDELGARQVCSYGVGAAFLELNLALLRPDVELLCTDFTPRTVARLAGLFPEADVRPHDLLADPPLAADLHLFHRIDSELSNRQWRRILPAFREPILLVATELLGVDGLRRERQQRHSATATAAGYIRTEAAFRSLWRRSHTDRRVAVGSLGGFLLTPRLR